jgi:hypothetical protein
MCRNAVLLCDAFVQSICTNLNQRFGAIRRTCALCPASPMQALRHKG